MLALNAIRQTLDTNEQFWRQLKLAPWLTQRVTGAGKGVGDAVGVDVLEQDRADDVAAGLEFPDEPAGFAVEAVHALVGRAEHDVERAVAIHVGNREGDRKSVV